MTQSDSMVIVKFFQVGSTFMHISDRCVIDYVEREEGI
jgi:hypothetical protein